MRVYHCKEEATLIGLLVRVLLGTCSCCFGYDDLHFCQWESGLPEVCFVLAQDQLSLVGVGLITIVECVRYDCIVFMTVRHVTLVGIPWSRCHDNVPLPSGPTYVDGIEARVLLDWSDYLVQVLGSDFAEDQTFLASDHELPRSRSAAHTIDVASLLNLKRV